MPRANRPLLTLLCTELIFQGSGAFNFINTTVCKLSPQVTTVDVAYIPLENGTTVLVGEPRDKSASFASVAYPLQAFVNFMGNSQRLAGHPIGNAISFALGGKLDSDNPVIEALVRSNISVSRPELTNKSHTGSISSRSIRV